uniref:Ig-like domain-containing protein n=1 Tax=Amphimedon queenslandica TaxID=400682 RepID=A0A1X7SET6_AMPQE
MICRSSSQVLALYDVTNSSSFNGSNLTSTDPSCPTLRNCFGNTSKLTDGDFGPMGSLNGQLGRFFAFNQNNSRLTFFVVAPVSTVVLYFFNSPTDGIGLPQLNVSNVGTIPYFFSNNDELTLTDSQLRTVTLLLNQELLLFQIDFTFPSNSRIDRFLVSEVQFFNGTPVSAPMEDIVFKDGSISVVTLGPDNIQSSISINCTVLNNGSFHWNWLFNNTIPITDELFIEDATRTSILYINGLSYSNEGNYTCTANSTAGSMSSKTISIRLE